MVDDSCCSSAEVPVWNYRVVCIEMTLEPTACIGDGQSPCTATIRACSHACGWQCGGVGDDIPVTAAAASSSATLRMEMKRMAVDCSVSEDVGTQVER